ncbi:MAG: dienelactone hydrolase family protein [Actinomycetota bacterium]|nr:dienelactone hydrolase family protein [Actinomycetota bacterium]
MSDVLLFHHALGLTDGVVAFADELRSAGHTVTTPDLFDGTTFDDVNDGVAHAGELGFGTIAESGAAHADGLGDRLVVAGFSLGVMPAQLLAQTRPGVVGAIFYHGAAPLEAFGDGTWPTGVALQYHFCEDDPWAEEDLPAAREIAGAVGGDLFVYPGSGHLVADPGSPDHDPLIAARILERTLTFLDARR